MVSRFSHTRCFSHHTTHAFPSSRLSSRPSSHLVLVPCYIQVGPAHKEPEHKLFRRCIHIIAAQPQAPQARQRLGCGCSYRIAPYIAAPTSKRTADPFNHIGVRSRFYRGSRGVGIIRTVPSEGHTQYGDRVR